MIIRSCARKEVGDGGRSCARKDGVKGWGLFQFAISLARRAEACKIVRPAVDVRRSVSCIGGTVQHPCIQKEAGRTKLDYLQSSWSPSCSRASARVWGPPWRRVCGAARPCARSSSWSNPRREHPDTRLISLPGCPVGSGVSRLRTLAGKDSAARPRSAMTDAGRCPCARVECERRQSLCRSSNRR